MNTFVSSYAFDAWLARLPDPKAKARILARLRSATLGNFGDCEPVGDGIFEMRIHTGPGYRVYYIRMASTVFYLLAAGRKSSQKRDIVRAKAMAEELKDGRT